MNTQSRLARTVVLMIVLLAIPLLTSASTGTTSSYWRATVMAPEGIYSIVDIWGQGDPAIGGMAIFRYDAGSFCEGYDRPMPIVVAGGDPRGLKLSGAVTDITSASCPYSTITLDLSLDPQVLYRSNGNRVLVKGDFDWFHTTVDNGWLADALIASGTVCFDSDCISVDGWNGLYEVVRSVRQ